MDDPIAARRFTAPPNRLIIRLYRLGLSRFLGGVLLLLTTIGRRSGRRHTVALQYEEVDGEYHVGAAKGMHADWVRNILVDPRVEVEVKAGCFGGLAVVITNPVRIADFLELRLRRRPRLVGRILAVEGLSPQPTRAQLEDYAGKIALVIIRRRQGDADGSRQLQIPDAVDSTLLQTEQGRN